MLLNYHAAQGGGAAQSRLSALSMAAPGEGWGTHPREVVCEVV